MFVIISSLLAYDTHIHGGVFAKSATGKFLQQTGTLPYVEVAWTKTMSTSARGYQWAEKNLPVYVNQTCTAVKPYTAFLRDAGIVAWNFVLDRCEAVKLVILEKTPVVVNFVSFNDSCCRSFKSLSFFVPLEWNLIFLIFLILSESQSHSIVQNGAFI